MVYVTRLLAGLLVPDYHEKTPVVQKIRGKAPLPVTQTSMKSVVSFGCLPRAGNNSPRSKMLQIIQRRGGNTGPNTEQKKRWKMLGFGRPRLKLSVSALERQNQGMGESTQTFWENREAPPEAKKEAIVVTTADCKGVPIRSPEGGKKMSVIGSVYNIDPYRRTPEDVLEALFAKTDDKKETGKLRPKPLAKHVRASLLRDENGAMQPSVDEIFTWFEQEVKQRNPCSNRPQVVLMDGQESLWNASNQQFGDNTVEILDHSTRQFLTV